MNGTLCMMAAALVATSATACSSPAATATSSHLASVQSVPQSRVPAVRLAPEAITRLGVVTAPVRVGAVPGPDGGRGGVRTSMSYAAVVYDRDGSSWAYTATGPTVFLRKPITVDYITGDVAVLTRGPAAGTPVVVVGSAELLGVEYDISGEE
jgi:hypothetical protein